MRLQHQHAQRSSSHRAVNNSDVSGSLFLSSDHLRPLQTVYRLCFWLWYYWKRSFNSQVWMLVSETFTSKCQIELSLMMLLATGRAACPGRR